MSGSVMRALKDDEPIMVAWKRYQETDDYDNTFKWAAHSEHRKGSLWAAFMGGFLAATEKAASLHENINPASDEERTNKAPGCGAMGAVIEYRDAIRKDLAP